MPVVRYFFFVGATLLALLMVLDAYVPKTPSAERTTASPDLSVIRIHSDRKWPERIVFDTTLPTIIPATNLTKVAVPAATNLAEVPAKATVRQAFAELSPSTPNQLQPADPRKVEAKPQRKRRTIARGNIGPPTLLVAQQPRIGSFGNAIW